MLTNKKISVVVVCYNDGGSVRELYRRVIEVMRQISPNFEIIYVNDASPDDAYDRLLEIAQHDRRVVVITHSRNFGSQNAYASGLEYCSGDAAITLDGDIQDPPELFPELVRKWLEGYEVVYGERIAREGSSVMNFFYRRFYRLFRRLSYIKVPLDAGDFGLIDRRVIDALNTLPERDRFMRGLRAWVGFRSIGVPYKRLERFSGATSNNYLSNLRWAKKGIFSFSYAPLEWISYLAMLVTVLSLVAIIIYIVLDRFYPAPRGFLTILIFVLFLGSIQLLSLSIIGEYISRIFEEVKQRPKYIRREILNDYRGWSNEDDEKNRRF